MPVKRAVHLTSSGTGPQKKCPQPTADQLPIPADSTIRSAYIHVPFCFHKCHYCDFYSLVDTRDRQAVFVERLVEELESFARERGGERFETIFIGGGTPTLLEPHLLVRLLAAVARCLPGRPELEFTVEANPETVTDEVARVLATGGVNRVSIGAQSFDLRHLKTLERWHDPNNVDRSVERLRDAGIENLNLDLISAIPGQTQDDWRRDLERALALEPDHLSCYSLTYEANTPMTAKVRLGRVQPADEDVEAAMFEATIDRLEAAGYEHYEISNFARPGRRCRHNLTYWTNGNWWPFGPSASGHVDGVRWKNGPRLGDYLGGTGWPGVTDVELIQGSARVGERLMLGLRLREGMPTDEIDAMLAADPVRRRVLDAAVREHLLERTDTHTRFTRRGLMLADDVLADLL